MRAVLQLIRLPAGFSAISNILAAHIIATAGSLQLIPLLLTSFASLCFYFGGMALNDCFDFHEDRRLRTDRPIVSGHLSLSAAWAVGLVFMVCGLILSAMTGIRTWVVSLLLCFFIVLYNSKRLSGVLSSLAMELVDT